MVDKIRLDGLAAGYRRDGYEVIASPKEADLPYFLREAGVDLLARKGERLVALSLSREGEETLRLATEVTREQALSLLAEAEALLTPKTLRSAIVISWAAFEAAAMVTSPTRSGSANAVTSEQVRHEVVERLALSAEEEDRITECRHLRNAIVHGVGPEDIRPSHVSFLLSLVRRLLGASGSAPRMGGNLSARWDRFDMDPWWNKAIEQAQKVLSDVLGTWKDTVSTDWNLARDPRSDFYLVLELSDLTGSVTGVFYRAELYSEDLLRERLNRLWGDLLELRSHSQLRSLRAETVGSHG